MSRPVLQPAHRLNLTGCRTPEQEEAARANWQALQDGWHVAQGEAPGVPWATFMAARGNVRETLQRHHAADLDEVLEVAIRHERRHQRPRLEAVGITVARPTPQPGQQRGLLRRTFPATPIRRSCPPPSLLEGMSFNE